MKSLNYELTPGQAKFAVMLEERAPYLMDLWDFDKCEYKPDLVEQYLGVASHGQSIMLRFFLGIWRHDNEFEFDFFEAVRVLDGHNIDVIQDWMVHPFWP